MNGIMNLDSYNVAELNQSEVVDTNGGALPWAAWTIITTISCHMANNWDEIKKEFVAGWRA